MFRYLVLASMLLLSACFMHNRSSSKTVKAKKTPQFEYGQTHEEVLATIKDRSETVVAEFNVPEGHLVAYAYHKYGVKRYKEVPYYLYFMNDTLIRKSPPEDLQEGAKVAVKNYYYYDRRDRDDRSRR